ncbi:MAG: hypothetical protein QOG09_647 [Solirubrobacterales bacterium]|jgi:hypothetical protein|nr:hypothetical protein [Solirubrobacterales bacterium]MDX6662545.1 hypothetical protein [Solirubrobacterales bacterium]
MDFSRLRRSEVIGAVASVVLLGSLLGLPWFSLSHVATRAQQNAWICGTDHFSCSGFDTFPILRWLLIAACAAPLILTWIVVRGNKLSWPPGEMTMVVGFTAFVLIAYNGLLDKPGSSAQEFGIGLSIGYWLALLAGLAMGIAGASRSLEGGGGAQRKPAGTI